MPRLEGRKSTRPVFQEKDLLIGYFSNGWDVARQYPRCCIEGCNHRIRDDFSVGVVVLKTNINESVGAICGIHTLTFGQDKEPPF